MRVFAWALACWSVGAAAADECDPESVVSYWTAKRCEDGGYARANQPYVDAYNRANQELREASATALQLNQQRAFLLEREAELTRWEEQINQMEARLSSSKGSAADIAQQLRIMRDQLIARGELDLTAINGELAKRPRDPHLMSRKELIERLLKTLADIVIPSSPIDLIPLKKPWNTIRTAVQTFFAIKENWFDT